MVFLVDGLRWGKRIQNRWIRLKCCVRKTDVSILCSRQGNDSGLFVFPRGLGVLFVREPFVMRHVPSIQRCGVFCAIAVVGCFVGCSKATSPQPKPETPKAVAVAPAEVEATAKPAALKFRSRSKSQSKSRLQRFRKLPPIRSLPFGRRSLQPPTRTPA